MNEEPSVNTAKPVPKRWIGAAVGVVLLQLCIMVSFLLTVVAGRFGFADWRFWAVVAVLSVIFAAAGYRVGRHLDERT